MSKKKLKVGDSFKAFVPTEGDYEVTFLNLKTNKKCKHTIYLSEQYSSLENVLQVGYSKFEIEYICSQLNI